MPSTKPSAKPSTNAPRCRLQVELDGQALGASRGCSRCGLLLLQPWEHRGGRFFRHRSFVVIVGECRQIGVENAWGAVPDKELRFRPGQRYGQFSLNEWPLSVAVNDADCWVQSLRSSSRVGAIALHMAYRGSKEWRIAHAWHCARPTYMRCMSGRQLAKGVGSLYYLSGARSAEKGAQVSQGRPGVVICVVARMPRHHVSY